MLNQKPGIDTDGMAEVQVNKKENVTENCLLIPPYSSSLVFQVLMNSKTGSYFVKPIYNFQPLNIFEDNEYVPLQTILEILDSRGRLDDFEELCGNRHYEIVKRGSYTVVIVLLLVLIFVCRRNVVKESLNRDKFLNKVK